MNEECFVALSSLKRENFNLVKNASFDSNENPLVFCKYGHFK